MFPVRQLVDVELIRDGGSLAATFEIEGGSRFVLFIPRNPQTRRFSEPALLNCDPKGLLPGGPFSGPRVQVSWDETRKAIGEMAAMIQSLSPRQTELLQRMKEVAARDGQPPPGL